MLGVYISCEPDRVVLRPCPARVTKISQLIEEALHKNSLSSDQAQRLAGKLIFLQTTSFGQVGKAALNALYSRSYSPDEHSTLNFALRASLVTLGSLLQFMKPRILPVVSNTRHGLIYTDAFFSPGDLQLKLKPHDAPKSWHPRRLKTIDQGWGYVVTISTMTFYAHGKAPDELLQRYGRRKAFIYFLELLAPVVLMASLHRVLPKFLVAFIDNQAGLTALTKGYGSDPAVNGMLTFFLGFTPAFGHSSAH